MDYTQEKLINAGGQVLHLKFDQYNKIVFKKEKMNLE